jgi:integrase
MRQRGTVEKYGSGWRWRFTIARDGGKRQFSQGGYATRREAQQGLTAALARLDVNGPTKTTRQTTGDYLTTWVDQYGRSQSRKASSVSTTSHLVRAYLIPRIGDVPLAKLDADRIAALYVDLLDNGRTGAGGRTGGLSAKSVRNIHGVLHKALSDAVKRKHLPANPADAVDLPTWNRPDLNVWDERQAATFLNFVESTDDPMSALWRLLLATGLRRGELLGLTWDDVDLVGGYLTVVRSRGTSGVDTPKTKKGRRTISLDAGTVDALARWKDRQEAAEVVFGAWPSPWVATDLDGRPIQPQAFTRRFQSAAKRAGLPVPRLHDGRHTAATLALQAGVPIHVVSGRLGHEQVSTTLDVYAAYLPLADRDAALRIGQLLATNVNRERQS